mgnify:CR=1 FL=1
MSSHRQAEFVVRLLDEQDQEIRVLDGVMGGSVSLSATTRLRASGQLSIQETGEEIDWLSHRVRIDYEPVGMEPWSLGVFLLSSPQDSHSESGTSWDVDLLGKLAVLDGDSIEQTLAVPAGTNLVEAAHQLIRDAGETRVAVTPSTATSASEMVWDPGTSVLTVVNELLDAAGYWACFTDGAGVVHLEPYVRPAARARTFNFVEGETAIHSAEWTREQDLAAVPNRVLLVGQGDQDRPALVGVATNEDPQSRFSRQRRGRWITVSETGVEAADQATITAKARRKLIEASTPQAKLQVSHMPIPVAPNHAGIFRSQGADSRVVLQSIEYQLDPTALVKSTLIEVVDL